MCNKIVNITEKTTPVVIVRNACKRYDPKNDSVSVLKNLKMTVPQGVIYGLLGPSGSGKTTLLNCLLGQKQLDKGDIWILGGAPNSIQSKVPGPSVGFMPQAPGVQDKYTTKETMYYFGGLAGMTNVKIKERINFLKNLLMLPDVNIALSHLSGGEKRRVSFAVALIHEPELLILDEPTVGLDPLLRETIWDYLYEITVTHQTTVILTTHYIEETRQANIVGLLRGGRILAEESPDSLLARFKVSTLEDVFFYLSVDQDNKKFDNKDANISNIFSTIESNVNKNSKNIISKSPNYIKPLIIKNIQWLFKNPVIVIAAIIVPIIQIVLFAIAIGGDPINLNLAVVNDETSIKNCGITTCNSTYLSCNFLQYLESKFTLTYYNSEDEAIASVMRGVTYASILLRENYTSAFKNRIYSHVNDMDLLFSTIDVYRDVSQYSLGIFLKVELVDLFQHFVKDYLNSCKVTNKRIMTVPIKWNKPVHGSNLPNYAEFVTPGLIVNAMVSFLAWSTTSSLIMELNNGVMERSLVLGANALHVLFSLVISELLLLVTQLVSIVICTFIVIDIPFHISLLLISVIYGLMGLCGMSYGFALASMCSTDSLVTMCIAGFTFPSAILTGMFWPIEGMSPLLRKISLILPFAGAADSLRSILHRGWTLTHPLIYTSIITILLWTLLFSLISVFCLKFKKR